MKAQNTEKIVSILELALANEGQQEDLVIGLEPLLDLDQFDWPSWQPRLTLSTPAAVGKASAEDCYKLLLATIRSERFSEGTIESAFDRGIIAAIADRLKQTL